LFFVSIYAYFSAGKIDSSLRLRERLKADGLRARVEPVDLGIRVARLQQGRRSVSPAEFDPVLRFHCGLDGRK